MKFIKLTRKLPKGRNVPLLFNLDSVEQFVEIDGTVLLQTKVQDDNIVLVETMDKIMQMLGVSDDKSCSSDFSVTISDPFCAYKYALPLDGSNSIQGIAEKIFESFGKKHRLECHAKDNARYYN